MLRGIDGYSSDVILERANPGWSAQATLEPGAPTRDSAMTRERAVERLLRHSISDERTLAGIMTEVERALEACPE